MPPEWTIAGEAGKVIDATPRSLEALQAEGAQVEFRSLDVDRLSWTIWLDDVSQADELVPEQGQQITLFRDGVRYFTGIAQPRIRLGASGPRVEMTVEGPWWWLRQVPLSSEIEDQSGTASERTAYVFPTGSPRTHLIALIARAIALGAPIQQGSIASCFSIPRLSLRNIPFSEAIAEVMRWVADGIVYFDYSVEGHPALCMQRRNAAPVVTLTPASTVVSDVNLRPRLDLQVEDLAVFFAKRETVDGKRVTVWDSQTAAVETPSGLPRRQAVLVSGPEIDTWLPQDFTDSVVVRSATLDVAAALMQYEPRLKASGAVLGVLPDQISLAPFTDGLFTLPAVEQRITDSEGNPIPAGYDYYLTAGETRDWWTKDGIEFIRARITATLYSQNVNSPDPEWFQTLGGQVYRYVIGTAAQRNVHAITVSAEVPLVKTLWATDTLLIRAEDYSFVNPPEGLADNLLATQNWLPHEGTVGPFATDGIPAGHHVGAVLNIAGSLSSLSNMRALITGQLVRLATDTMTYTVGAPARYSYRDLVNRFRQSGADNIVWLVESVSGDPGENPEPDPELQPPADLPDHVLAYNGDYLTWNGAYITYTPDEVPSAAILNEDGTYELDEAGNIALDESAP